MWRCGESDVAWKLSTLSPHLTLFTSASGWGFMLARVKPLFLRPLLLWEPDQMEEKKPANLKGLTLRDIFIRYNDGLDSD